MPLPFRPESMEVAKTRLAAALVTVWDAADVARRVKLHGGSASRPGKYRKHLFDFADGIRLIVSKDKMPVVLKAFNSDTVIHVSASFKRGYAICDSLDALADTEAKMGAFAKLAAAKIGELLDADCEETPAFWTGAACHWFLEA